MNKITFISTIHKGIGKCNSDELLKVIERIGPEVIFLEALDETYSSYDQQIFASFGVFHNKLEINAIQRYCSKNSCDYIPVLDNGLSDAFDRKYNLVCQFREVQELLDNFNTLASKNGFKFLNSIESVDLQDQMRQLESRLLINSGLEQSFKLNIDEYEESMMRNIYLYCSSNQFNSAIFMCGVAHRKSIIEKIEKFNGKESVNITWEVYGN